MNKIENRPTLLLIQISAAAAKQEQASSDCAHARRQVGGPQHLQQLHRQTRVCPAEDPIRAGTGQFDVCLQG